MYIIIILTCCVLRESLGDIHENHEFVELFPLTIMEDSSLVFPRKIILRLQIVTVVVEQTMRLTCSNNSWSRSHSLSKYSSSSKSSHKEGSSSQEICFRFSLWSNTPRQKTGVFRRLFRTFYVYAFFSWARKTKEDQMKVNSNWFQLISKWFQINWNWYNL